MKTKKTNNEKKKSQKANPSSHCGDLQKMAEMMKTCCSGEGGAIDCCSMMRRMTERDKEGEPEKTETQKQPKGREND